MAKLVDKKHGETVYTLELTEKELVTLTSALGEVIPAKRLATSSSWGLNSLTQAEDLVLYRHLKVDVLGVRY